MKPLRAAPLTDEDRAANFHLCVLRGPGPSLFFAQVLLTSVESDRRDAALMLWLTVRCDHERWLREEFGPGGLPGPAAVVMEHAPHLWRASPFNITRCA